MAKLAEVRAVGIRAAVEVEPLWGVPETASYLGVPESTVYRWCSRGGPVRAATASAGTGGSSPTRSGPG